jgi:hypothetical protein
MDKVLGLNGSQHRRQMSTIMPSNQVAGPNLAGALLNPMETFAQQQ